MSSSVHVRFTVELRDTITGERAAVEHVHPYGMDNAIWYWTEGNHACDCNRSSAFGHKDEPCGSSRYVIERVVAPDGTVLGTEADLEARRMEG